MQYKPSYYNYIAKRPNGCYFLYNLLTGGLSEFEPHEYEDLTYVLEHCNEEMTPERDSIKDLLVNKSFLIPEEHNELEVIRMRNMSRRFKELSQHVIIMPTLDCNFACTYCYETRKKGFMSEEIINGLINWGKHVAPDYKLLNFSWFGGEPFLDFSIIERVNSEMKKICEETDCAFNSSATTNGYLITDEVIKKIDELNLRSFQITVDGTAESHNKYRPLRNGDGTFDVVFNNIIKILEHTQAAVSLRVNVDNRNYEEVKKLIDMIPDKCKTERLRMYFRKIHGSPNPDAEYNQNIAANSLDNDKYVGLFKYALESGLYIKYHIYSVSDIYCDSCIKNSFVLSPEGDLYKCTIESETGQKVGTLNAEGEMEIDAYRHAKWMSYVPGDDEKCRECKFLPMCQGGCRFSRLQGQVECPYEAFSIDGFLEILYLSLLHERPITM